MNCSEKIWDLQLKYLNYFYSGWSRSSSRPIITHANESLNKNKPPEPTRPPPDEEDDASNSSHSETEDFTEGHDVEIDGTPVEPDDEEAPTAGIISKNSVNFQVCQLYRKWSQILCKNYL